MLDDNLHEGYNYYKWENSEDYPRYQYYRFYGPKKGGCGFNEIVLTGVETIDNSDEDYTCQAKVVIEGQD